MKLSDFGLCKPLDCSNLQEKDFSLGNNLSGALQSDGRPLVPKRTQQEQLQHWQRNRRMLVSFVTSHDWYDCYHYSIASINIKKTASSSTCFLHYYEGFVFIFVLWHSFKSYIERLQIHLFPNEICFSMAFFKNIYGEYLVMLLKCKNVFNFNVAGLFYCWNTWLYCPRSFAEERIWDGMWLVGIEYCFSLLIYLFMSTCWWHPVNTYPGGLLVLSCMRCS